LQATSEKLKLSRRIIKMGSQSIVHGYILERDTQWMTENRLAIQSFNFDERYPFTNIFWGESPHQYFFPAIGFIGSYNQIEAHWKEWLWKFSQMLSCLEAWEAHVYLNSIRGQHYWQLEPQSVYLGRQMSGQDKKSGELPPSLKGEPWGIVEAPQNDFTLTPWPEDNSRSIWNPEQNKFESNEWTQYVERWG
jgi:hypothetical protein